MIVAVAVAGLSQLTREIGIGLEGADSGSEGIAGVQLLVAGILLGGIGRTPTLVVPQGADHRVGGFGFRTRLLRPKARKTGTEIEFEGRREKDRQFRSEGLAGAVDAGLIAGEERGSVPLL